MKEEIDSEVGVTICIVLDHVYSRGFNSSVLRGFVCKNNDSYIRLITTTQQTLTRDDLCIPEARSNSCPTFFSRS